MKQTLTILALFVIVAAHGQEQPRVVAQYERHARTGSFLTRWYHEARGTSTLWKEQLTLYENQTYRYVYQGGECATFDTDESGIWEKAADLLLLSSQRRFLVREDRLYLVDTPIQEKTWVMRKVRARK